MGLWYYDTMAQWWGALYMYIYIIYTKQFAYNHVYAGHIFDTARFCQNITALWSYGSITIQIYNGVINEAEKLGSES